MLDHLQYDYVRLGKNQLRNSLCTVVTRSLLPILIGLLALPRYHISLITDITFITLITEIFFLLLPLVLELCSLLILLSLPIFSVLHECAFFFFLIAAPITEIILITKLTFVTGISHITDVALKD